MGGRKPPRDDRESEGPPRDAAGHARRLAPDDDARFSAAAMMIISDEQRARAAHFGRHYRYCYGSTGTGTAVPDVQ